MTDSLFNVVRALVLVLLFIGVHARAQFADQGGIDIRNGDVIAGTAHVGASQLQPHYLIDSSSQEYQSLLRDLRAEFRGRNLTEFEKIDLAAQFVERRFPRTNYDDAKYLSQNLAAIKAGKPIALSEIIRGGAGVCREHNMILHLLLKDEGIATRYVTAKVASGASPGHLATEDHSLLTYEDKISKKKLAVDAYFPRFHGQDYGHLTAGNIDANGKNTATSLDRVASTTDSVFPRVREMPRESVSIIGERNYTYKVPAEQIDSQTSKVKEGSFSYKTTADGKTPPEPVVSCRKRLLRGLLHSL